MLRTNRALGVHMYAVGYHGQGFAFPVLCLYNLHYFIFAYTANVKYGDVKKV